VNGDPAPGGLRRRGRRFWILAAIAVALVVLVAGWVGGAYVLRSPEGTAPPGAGPPIQRVGGDLVLANGTSWDIAPDSFRGIWLGPDAEFEFYGSYSTVGTVGGYLLTTAEFHQLQGGGNVSRGTIVGTIDLDHLSYVWSSMNRSTVSIDTFAAGGYYAFVFLDVEGAVSATVHVTSAIQFNDDLS